MSALKILLIGLALCASGVLARYLVWKEERHRFGIVVQENTTVDPENPPLIRINEEPGGGTTFMNVGGVAKFTPKPGFINYEDEIKKRWPDLYWVEFLAIALAAIGICTMIASPIVYFFV